VKTSARRAESSRPERRALLRRRYTEVIREEIAATVADPGEVDDEIRFLLAALERL